MSVVVKEVLPRKILDSRGEWTIEVVIKLSNGLETRASAGGERIAKFNRFLELEDK